MAQFSKFETKERFINLSSIHKITNTNKSFTIYYDNGKEISFYDQEFNVINEWLNAIHINISSNSSQITEKSFNIIAEISRSKYSVIKLVENKSTHKQYAMKIINKSLLSAQNKIHTAMTERNILMQVNHPFIVNLYYSFQNTTNFYFVMEYMKSGDLFNCIKFETLHFFLVFFTKLEEMGGCVVNLCVDLFLVKAAEFLVLFKICNNVIVCEFTLD